MGPQQDRVSVFPPDVGLVGDDDKAESSLLEPLGSRDGISESSNSSASFADRLSILTMALFRTPVSIRKTQRFIAAISGHANQDRNSERSRNECGVPPSSGIRWAMLSSVTYPGATVRHGSVGFNKSGRE